MVYIYIYIYNINNIYNVYNIYKQLYTQTNIYIRQTYTQDINIKFSMVEIWNYNKEKINCSLRFTTRLWSYELPSWWQNQRAVKPFFYVMYSITEFKRKAFVIRWIIVAIYSNKWSTLFGDRRFGLVILLFSRRDCFSFGKLEQRRW